MLIISFNEFEKGIQEKLDKGEELRNANLTSERDYSTFDHECRQWEDQTIEFLRKVFDSPDNRYVKILKNTRRPKKSQNPSVQELYGAWKQLLKFKVNALRYIYKSIKVSDLIRTGDDELADKRKNLKAKEKKDLILKKLYEIKDMGDIEIKEIFDGNGIPYNTKGEIHEWARYLEDLRMIKLSETDESAEVQLSLDGQEYIEDLMDIKEEDTKSENQQDLKSLYKKIDEIIEKLEKLDVEHEVLFEEMEDLKYWASKMSNKNWKQLLKGKLIDIGVSFGIDKVELNGFYKYLTDEILKLPSS